MQAMQATYQIPENVIAETAKHAREVEQYLAGRLPEELFRSRRVPRGIYEQRRKGLYMVRIRLPGGLLPAGQARVLAELSRRYAGGSVHFTTRQDAQLHDVAIADTPALLERLLAAGLTPLGGGGNTVRNITACSHSGIFTGEIFDPLPYALALTGYLLQFTSSYNLPRKFKIAFSCCSGDDALARVNDLGFVARIRDGRKGFAVYVGGGMGASSRVGDLFTPFLPAEDVIRMAEAVKRVFDRLGDRRNRQRARLRFAVERLGAERFRRELEQELQMATAEGVPEAVPVELAAYPAPPAGEAALSGGGPGYRAWLERAVRPQKQEGLFCARILLKRGDLPAGDLLRLAEIAAHCGAARFRIDRRQDLLIPSIPAGRLPSVYRALKELSVDVRGTEGEPWMVSCKGAATCSLGVCRSQDLNAAVSAAAAAAGLPPELFRELAFHTSGCPNNCGQHAAAGLGFFGAARRAGSRSYPIYHLVAGGGPDGRGGFHLSETVAVIPARNVPRFTVALLRDYRQSGAGAGGFPAYWKNGGAETARKLAALHAEVPGYDEQPEFYRDWGSGEDFSLAGRSQGECGAGVIELIAEELKKSEAAYARAARRAEEDHRGQEDLLRAVVAAAGSLLVTKGIEPGSPEVALKEFERHFIDRGLAGEEHRALLALARAAPRRDGGVRLERAAARRFLDAVQQLYDQMDASLNFPVQPPGRPREEGGARAAAQELNLRGVACPMNFVHAKIALEQLGIGDILVVILDGGEPARNVPASFKEQGQEVISVEPADGGCFRVCIRRKK